MFVNVESVSMAGALERLNQCRRIEGGGEPSVGGDEPQLQRKAYVDQLMG